MLEACRTCLRLIDVDNSPFYEIEADNVQLSTESCRYKLLSAIPEMVLNITPKSMLCARCHLSLEAMFEFKAQCLKTENIITQYFQAKPDVDIKNLDLKDVSAFSMSYAGDITNTEDETRIEYVAVKQEVESFDVEEQFDESIIVVKPEIDNYLSVGIKGEQPENSVLDLKKDRKTGMFECPVCSKGFARRSRLKDHMFIHTDERPYKCTICSKGFNERGTLNKHVKVHSKVKEYECQVCGKKFSRCDSLTVHMMMHTKEQVCNYTCEYCAKNFNNRSLLNKHLCSHSKPYRCELCDQRFTQKTNLEIHMRKHTGERPFVCDVCGKDYCSNSKLREHMQTHPGEHPYRCETCQKGFILHSSLVEHQKRHSGVKSFECELCKKGFVHKRYLRQHMRVHTKI